MCQSTEQHGFQHKSLVCTTQVSYNIVLEICEVFSSSSVVLVQNNKRSLNPRWRIVFFWQLWKRIEKSRDVQDDRHFNGLDWSLLVIHLKLKIRTTLGYIVSLILLNVGHVFHFRFVSRMCQLDEEGSPRYIVNNVINYHDDYGFNCKYLK